MYLYTAQTTTEPIQCWGLPSRIQCDKRGENTEIAWFMLSHPRKGAGRVCTTTALKDSGEMCFKEC